MNRNTKFHFWYSTFISIIFIPLVIAILFISSISLAQQDALIHTDCLNLSWVKIEPITSPPKRAYHVIAYDNESDRVILFGGDSGPKALDLYSDTWSYDHNSFQWVKLNPQISPVNRAGHAMTYEAESDRIILFGGGLGSTETGIEYSKLYGDTWEYDFDLNTWNELSPETGPSPRVYCDLTYDEKCDRIILFGGNLWSAKGFTEDYQSETWILEKLPTAIVNPASDYPTTFILEKIIPIPLIQQPLSPLIYQRTAR